MNFFAGKDGSEIEFNLIKHRSIYAVYMSSLTYRGSEEVVI